MNFGTAITSGRAAAREIDAYLKRNPVVKRQVVKGLTNLQRKFRQKPRSYDRAMAKKRSQIGEPPGSGLAKHLQYRSDGWTASNTNTLHKIEALEIPRLSSTFSLNSRLRDIVYLSGIKVCFTVRSQKVTDPLYFNLALISAKNRGALGDETDFFRSYAGSARAQNFDDASLAALDRHCLPINADEHVVHFHERVMLLAKEDSSNGSGKVASLYTFEKYIPIKRQIRFEGSTGSPETKFQLCHWSGLVGDTITASQTPGTGHEYEVKMISIFKEPQPVLEFR